MRARAITLSLIGAFAIGGSLDAPQASAQASARTLSPYTLAGTVTDGRGNFVAGAEVALIERDSAARFTRSDSTGQFTMSGLTAASLTLRVRRFGFHPQVVNVNVTKAGRTAKVFVELEPSVAMLDPVVVDTDAVAERPNPRLVAFKERAATNSFGHYVTEEMLARLRPQYASDALRTVPGVVVGPAPLRRIGNSVRLRGCGAKGLSPERVGPLVWVDGVRLPGAEIDDVTQGMDIAAMEIYNSFAGVPAQYFDRTAVCGTILVWTKHR